MSEMLSYRKPLECNWPKKFENRSQ